ncbi:MAG: hypothetical protein HUJ90_04520, partial [Bacteroidales bacterium]|nr:hypothetical protein [Bacteroidales bacterium]
MKNRLFLVLSAVAILAVSSFVSCTKDLQNDLSNLDSKVTTLQGTVDDLNKQIAAGAVITNVEKNGGVVKVTLSNGKTFEVKDGKDADVWTIVDGYWAKNGEITEYQAVADQWVPGEDGYWYCNGEKTDISWKASSLTAVYEDGILTLYNVDGTDEPVVIGGNLFGLTIVPSVIKEGLPVTFFYELVV